MWDGGGGCNDVARNNSVDGMKHTMDLKKNSNHTNVILMNFPHTQELVRYSCVNNAVEAFNRKLWDKMKRFENVEMINLGTERDFYMTHGQHLNMS
jgi:hypothetical protein